VVLSLKKALSNFLGRIMKNGSGKQMKYLIRSMKYGKYPANNTLTSDANEITKQG
jgi:hypothetical protein